jgi:group I intron endonuclease
MKTGIYQIKSIITNRVYIGSAVNIKTSWSRHRSDLLKKVHHSQFLQRHYDKYSLDDLEFSIIEECEKEFLLIKEQYYLDTLSCDFNIAKVAGSCIGITKSQDFKDKLSTLTKGEKNPTYGLERTKEWRDNISKANKGQKAWNKGKTNIYDEKTLKKIKEGALNRKKLSCEYCNKNITPQNYARWHGNKCKQKQILITENII